MVRAIDVTSFNRKRCNRPYGKRIRCYFQAVKTTTFVDYETNVIINVHRSMKQPHDSQIGWREPTKNPDNLGTITAVKTFDWDDLREQHLPPY